MEDGLSSKVRSAQRTQWCWLGPRHCALCPQDKPCDLVCRDKAYNSERDFVEFRASLKERKRE